MTATLRELYDSQTDFRTYDETAEHYAYTLPDNAVVWESWPAMHRRMSADSHFYDRDAVRFFRGRSDRHLHGGRFWVESKKYENAMTGESDARVYQVAWVSDYNGHLSVERWGAFDNLRAARRHCQLFADAIADPS